MNSRDLAVSITSHQHPTAPLLGLHGCWGFELVFMFYMAGTSLTEHLSCPTLFYKVILGAWVRVQLVNLTSILRIEVKKKKKVDNCKPATGEAETG